MAQAQRADTAPEDQTAARRPVKTVDRAASSLASGGTRLRMANSTTPRFATATRTNPGIGKRPAASVPQTLQSSPNSRAMPSRPSRSLKPRAVAADSPCGSGCGLRPNYPQAPLPCRSIWRTASRLNAVRGFSGSPQREAIYGLTSRRMRS
jgi:hypothetical protein